MFPCAVLSRITCPCGPSSFRPFPAPFLPQVSVRDAVHTIGSSTRSDLDRVSGLTGAFRLMAATFAGAEGRCYTAQEFLNVARDVMRLSHGGSYSSFQVVSSRGDFASSSSSSSSSSLPASLACRLRLSMSAHERRKHV